MISLNLNEALRERDAEEQREARVRRNTKPKVHKSGPPAIVSRRWDGARYSDLTADLPRYSTTANQDLRSDLRALRAAHRYLFQNNGVMKKFAALVETNVIGAAGMRLRITFDQHGNSTPQRDKELAKYIQGKFAEWTRPETCSASGKLSFNGALCYAMRVMARDGEFLCRELKGAKAPPDNPFGYALSFRDVNWLDENYNCINEFGNRVLMSVEYNDFDRPVRYWLTRPSTDYLYAEYKQREAYRTPIPAEDVIHKFLVTEDEQQARGVPWGAAAMEPIHTLAGFINAELYASRAAACVTDYVIPPKDEEDDDSTTPVDPNDPDSQAQRREDYFKTRDLESAMMMELPPGYDVKSNDPKHPNAQLGETIKSIKRDVGAALLVRYESLSNDREGVSFSSIRDGIIEDRDLWELLHLFVIDHICHRVFQNWLKESLLTGAVVLSIRDYQRVQDSWRARGWDWVNPLQDIQAAILAIMNRIGSRTKYCAERGEDADEILNDLESEDKAAEAAGLLRPDSAPAPAKPKTDMSSPGEKPPAASDNADEEDVSRVLPMFESQLLRGLGAIGGAQQPIIIVVNSEGRLTDMALAKKLLRESGPDSAKPANGDSQVLS